MACYICRHEYAVRIIPEYFNMKTLFGFIIFLLACLLITAVIYYPVYQLLNLYFDARPDRVFYRTAMILGIIGFWPVLRHLGLLSKPIVGFDIERKKFTSELFKGALIGILIMVLIVSLLVIFGARRLDFADVTLIDILKTLLLGLVSATLIAFIEETFFRGALQGGMRRTSSFLASAIAISLFYAALHFTRPPQLAETATVDWFTGFHMLAGMTYKYAHFDTFLDSFLALFMAGFFLSLLREHRQSIAICIGVHLGWVLIIRFAKLTTSSERRSPTAWLVGDYDHITGWLALLIISLISLAYWYKYIRKAKIVVQQANV